MITKNEIPIFEYDDSSKEVIAPDHDCEGLKLPEKCLFAFLGDVVDSYAQEHGAEVVEELTIIRGFTNQWFRLRQENFRLLT